MIRYWRDDLVGFLHGCSFTLWALTAAGLPLAHQDQGVNVGMYVTHLDAKPSLAIFHAPGHMFITDRPHEFDTKEGYDA